MSQEKANLPHTLCTERLHLCMPDAPLSAAFHLAIHSSLQELQPWMPWATPAPTERMVELYLLESKRRRIALEEFPTVLRCRRSKRILGAAGILRVDWSVPKAEIGYWLAHGYGGQGLMTEAVVALRQAAFEELKMKRLEIRTSVKNTKSQRLALRAGFELEAVLKQDRREQDGRLSDTKLFVCLDQGAR